MTKSHLDTFTWCTIAWSPDFGSWYNPNGNTRQKEPRHYSLQDVNMEQWRCYLGLLQTITNSYPGHLSTAHGETGEEGHMLPRDNGSQEPGVVWRRSRNAHSAQEISSVWHQHGNRKMSTEDATVQGWRGILYKKSMALDKQCRVYGV